MCFSAEMDLAAGLLVTGIGIDTLRQARAREQLAIAAVPLVLGTHLLVETPVWWSLEGHLSPAVGDLASWAYVAIALVVVPALVPWAFLRLGTSGRAGLDRFFLACGLAAAAAGLFAIGLEPVGRRIDGHHIAYHPGVAWSGVVLAAYVLATCGPSLLARSAELRWFGVGNLAVVALLAWIQQNAVISLWCVWAASTSLLINLALRRTHVPAVASLVAPDGHT
ncbi:MULTISPECIES: DUF6629 family protein [unclassified Nocardioides]|uniref:DUF6629 family protein n=1 Tax=unclassified Nocardioides TaxID=2615069 RepID=UPI000AFE8F7C|nr:MULTISPECIES: DUF6629 family protein [unclassified Nocardioides]